MQSIPYSSRVWINCIVRANLRHFFNPFFYITILSIDYISIDRLTSDCHKSFSESLIHFTKMFLFKLPIELILSILAYLDAKSLFNIRTCNRQFSILATYDIFWKPLIASFGYQENLVSKKIKKHFQQNVAMKNISMFKRLYYVYSNCNTTYENSLVFQQNVVQQLLQQTINFTN
jgi:F-box domain